MARDIRKAGEEAIFAPTPPLESLRTILSLGATDLPGRKPWCRDPLSEERCQVAAFDISRAYLHAETDPEDPSYVDLPKEDEDSGRGLCGLLRKHMYGTRRAADGWQQHYQKFMRDAGFRQGKASPCLFVHVPNHVVVSVHGDDFTVVGAKSKVDWFENMLKKTYEYKCIGRLGPAKADCKEMTILNRVIRWTPQGLEYEADPRQGEKLLEELGLDDGCNTAATPGVKATPQQLNEDIPLPPEEHTRFRGIAARANYLAADRAE